MYTVMEAGDIITCFLQTESEYPPNTFLSKNEKKILGNMKRARNKFDY